MQLTVNRMALSEALGVASAIAVSRTTKDALKCVRLTADAEGLLISATDLEVGLRVRVLQVEVKKKGDTLVPADKLMSIARESLDETLVIESVDQVCHIRGQHSHFEVYGQDPRDFPPVPGLDGPADIQIDGQVLSGLVNRTVFAVAKENTRYAINGVLWEKRGKRLALVATDGRRLARAVGSAEQTIGDDNQAIVPSKTVHLLQKVLSTCTEKVAIQLSSNQIIAQCGQYVVSSALAEGNFPHYEEVIPRDNDKRVELDTEEFLNAVRQAALLTNEQSKGIRLVFGKELLVLSSRAPEQGEATVSIKASYAGDEVAIGFNPGFVIDALRVAGSPSVTLELRDGNRPAVLKAGQDFCYVIMPVSL